MKDSSCKQLGQLRPLAALATRAPTTLFHRRQENRKGERAKMAITIKFRAFFSPLNDIAMPDAINLGSWAMAKQRVGEMKGRWLEVASRRWGTSFLEPQE